MTQQATAYGDRGRRVLGLVKRLQRCFVDELDAIEEGAGGTQRCEPITWLRDEGRHGGGTRLVMGDTCAFDRASVNVSAIHYDDMPEKALASATALSTIVHPLSLIHI